MKKRLLTAAAIATIGMAGLSTGAVFATTDTESGDDPMSGLVSAVAEKFNLKAADVQAVFDEQRSAMEADREQEVKDKVAALVKDGKLTQAQANKIDAKRTELQAERESSRDDMKDKTAEERKTEMETKKSELDAWLTENDIDGAYKYLLMSGRGGHGGPGMGGPRHGDADSSSTEG